MSGIIQTMTPEEFSPHCPRTEERNTHHLWTIHHLRVHITGPLGPSEESPSSLCELGKCRGGGPDRGPGVGLGARWEASLHPSGLEGIQQSGSYKGVSARGRRRGQGQGQGPTGQNPSLAQDAGLPGSVRHWAGGPGKEATTVLAPLPPSACVLPSRLRIHRSSELALRLLGCFLPLYRVLFGIRKGSASSSWRQEGACSQGHLQLGRGRRG